MKTPFIYLISGERGTGKTTLALSISKNLKSRGKIVAGIAAVGLWKGDKLEGFDLVELRGRQRAPLCRREAPAHWQEQAGPYRFSPEALSLGRHALEDAITADLVIVDEIGPLELSGGGWFKQINLLAASRTGPMLWVIRPSLIEEASRLWGPFAQRWNSQSDAESIAAILANILPSKS